MKYDEIKSLVEEVRGIISDDRIQEDEDAREALYQEAADDVVAEIFEAKKKGKFKKTSKMGPFKRVAVGKAIGPGPKDRRVRRRAYWSCRSQGPYTQICRGSDGERKTVRIKRGYKKKYNKLHRAYLAGKKGKLSVAAKRGKKARAAARQGKKK